jgi:hypothetical protein
LVVFLGNHHAYFVVGREQEGDIEVICARYFDNTTVLGLVLCGM